jgi:DNA replication and repair protein RecF
MRLEHLFVQDYRNLIQADLDFSPKLNCFVGHNGMGKTNLLDVSLHQPSLINFGA